MTQSNFGPPYTYVRHFTEPFLAIRYTGGYFSDQMAAILLEAMLLFYLSEPQANLESIFSKIF